jgi:cellulose synthase/poly-beta-1,6-N-acetylglucosamine synthase-like glycosyltransferase
VITALLFAVCAATLVLLSLLVIYECLLAAVALFPRRARQGGVRPRSRFVVLVPAYNEEAGIAATLESLSRVEYPASLLRIVVVADRCDDGTAGRARACGAECLERSSGQPGKGPAIAWAIAELQRRGEPFDALVLLDADTVVDRAVLGAFDRGL